ncbi:hypothetical protein D3C87_1539410 [compost metagenome]
MLGTGRPCGMAPIRGRSSPNTAEPTVASTRATSDPGTVWFTRFHTTMTTITPTVMITAARLAWPR